MKKLFVFDLDDTLIDNVHDYAEPILEACRVIIQALGNAAPHVSQIVAMEQEIDKRRVKETNPATGRPYLWSMERFPGTLVETYREICRRAGRRARAPVADVLWDIGLGAFDERRYAANINPHARGALNFLRARGDVAVLCTKGDERVQKKKIAALHNAGIDHFAATRIVDDKTPDVFARMARDAGYPGTVCYSVGNSYDSDIAPALAADFRGIFIPVETWEVIGRMDEILAGVDRARCTVLQSLEDLTTRYGELR